MTRQISTKEKKNATACITAHGAGGPVQEIHHLHPPAGLRLLYQRAGNAASAAEQRRGKGRFCRPGGRKPRLPRCAYRSQFAAGGLHRKKIREQNGLCGGHDFHRYHRAHQGGEYFRPVEKHQAGHLCQPVYRKRDPDVSAQEQQQAAGEQHRRTPEHRLRRQRAAAFGCSGDRWEPGGSRFGAGGGKKYAAGGGGPPFRTGEADHGAALRPFGRGGAYAEGSGGYDRHFPKLHFKAGKAHHQTAERRFGTHFLNRTNVKRRAG